MITLILIAVILMVFGYLSDNLASIVLGGGLMMFVYFMNSNPII